MPTIYERDGIFYLVTAFEKKLSVMKFADYYRSKTPKVLAVDLNLGRKNRAVCSLVGMNGTVHKIRYIGLKECNRTDVHRLLGLIARNVSGLVVIPKGHGVCKKLWRKVRAANDNYAHHLSKQLVDLAVKWGARVIVFENLKHFGPDKHKCGSARMRQRVGYWLHRRVMKYTAYKAKARGALIALVNPKKTSTRCSRRGSLNTSRASNILECSNCDTVHNSHVNAAIGMAWFIREEKRLQHKTAQTTFCESLQLSKGRGRLRDDVPDRRPGIQEPIQPKGVRKAWVAAPPLGCRSFSRADGWMPPLKWGEDSHWATVSRYPIRRSLRLRAMGSSHSYCTLLRTR